MVAQVPWAEPGSRFTRDFEAKIVAYFEHPYTNAVLKGADNVIQNVKRRARGFRNIDYFATMIYLTCGKLDLEAVTTTLTITYKQRIAKVLKPAGSFCKEA